MLAFIFNFGTLEILLVVMVAVLVFGRNLPTVAVQAAGALHKLRRTLADLRRETGIDEELRQARRTLDSVVPPAVRRMDVREAVRRKAEEFTRDVEEDAESPPKTETSRPDAASSADEGPPATT